MPKCMYSLHYAILFNSWIQITALITYLDNKKIPCIQIYSVTELWRLTVWIKSITSILRLDLRDSSNGEYSGQGEEARQTPVVQATGKMLNWPDVNNCSGSS